MLVVVRCFLLTLIMGAVLYLVVTPDPTMPASPSQDVSEVITEDSPLWECSTMGNRQCPPVEIQWSDGTTEYRCADPDAQLYTRDVVPNDDPALLVCQSPALLSV